MDLAAFCYVVESFSVSLPHQRKRKVKISEPLVFGSEQVGLESPACQGLVRFHRAAGCSDFQAWGKGYSSYPLSLCHGAAGVMYLRWLLQAKVFPVALECAWRHIPGFTFPCITFISLLEDVLGSLAASSCYFIKNTSAGGRPGTC